MTLKIVQTQNHTPFKKEDGPNKNVYEWSLQTCHHPNTYKYHFLVDLDLIQTKNNQRKFTKAQLALTLNNTYKLSDLSEINKTNKSN